MTDLDAFLRKNIEGYLFSDLREMQRIPVGFPLLMTTFAGIELLGALLSISGFNTETGSHYFISYWKTHLYPDLRKSDAIGNALYKLVRHGIAHNFVLKGPVAIVCSQPSVHLTRDSSGVIYVDAVQLATDFMNSFTGQVKPLIASAAGGDRTSITARLGEIESEYRLQASRLPLASLLPLHSVAATSGASLNIAPNSGPANSGQSGPSGPTFGN